MRLYFDEQLIDRYKSPSQKIRVLTESWVSKEVFCPSCGADVVRYESNRPVADFHCQRCEEQYELKSKGDGLGHRIVNGAYRTVIERLTSNTNPNLFLLNYDSARLTVSNFFVIPKHFFVPDIVEKRRPLSPRARRSGWIGCNIVLGDIPQAGRIFYVKRGMPLSRTAVLQTWQKTLFLKRETKVTSRAWMLDIMNCIDKLRKKEFSLEEIYNFEAELRAKHPRNSHVKDKLRQQLQLLRNNGYLEFIGRGKYRLSQ